MQLERMVRFDNTFKMVMAHYKKLMAFSFRDLNNHIKKSIFEQNPSGCLKFYNELINDTNLDIPPKITLKSDVFVFRKTVEKI
jgi:hypothetical protein